jgi:hypothetical protein
MGQFRCSQEGIQKIASIDAEAGAVPLIEIQKIAYYVFGQVVRNGFFMSQALANELKERARGELDSAPFNYVMNGSLPVPFPSRTNSFVSMPILAADGALEG